MAQKATQWQYYVTLLTTDNGNDIEMTMANYWPNDLWEEARPENEKKRGSDWASIDVWPIEGNDLTVMAIICVWYEEGN